MAPRAIAYLCKSSAPDSSFNAQLDRISAWCTQAGVTIVDDVQEDSWGSYASDSPMLSELLLRLDGGVAEMLLFTHPTF